MSLFPLILLFIYVTGVLLLTFAIGLSLLLRTDRGSTWGPSLLGIYGLTFIGIGIFVTPNRWTTSSGDARS